MKLKTGPLLVIGALVVLVGLTLVLTPAPPPASTAKSPGQEEQAATSKKDTKKSEPAELTLAQIRAMLGDAHADAAMQGVEQLQHSIIATRDANKKTAFVDYAISLARSDRRETVRVAAVNMLKSVENLDSGIPIKIAQSDPSPDVREAAILTLSRFPSGGDVEQALRAFAKDPDPGLRNAAVISLTQMLSGSADSAQLAGLLGIQDNDAAAQAALGLRPKGPAALPALTNVLYHGKSGPQRQGAAMCIALICSGFNPSIDAFAKQAQATHRQEQAHTMTNPAGVAPLVWALANDPYAPTREIAAQGLGYLGDVRAARPLATALKDPDALVRRRAAAALVTVPASTVLPDLAAAATADKVAEVRRNAVEALGWIGSAEAVTALSQATKDAVPAVRRAAAMQLGRIADPAALQALSELLGTSADPDADVRWAAVAALGKLKDRRAEKVLVQCLADPSPQVSNSAERALQRLGIVSKESAGFQG